MHEAARCCDMRVANTSLRASRELHAASRARLAGVRVTYQRAAVAREVLHRAEQHRAVKARAFWFACSRVERFRLRDLAATSLGIGRRTKLASHRDHIAHGVQGIRPEEGHHRFTNRRSARCPAVLAPRKMMMQAQATAHASWDRALDEASPSRD